MNNTNSRKQHPLYTTERVLVPNNRVNWSIPFNGYLHERPFYMHSAVIDNLNGPEEKKWAEPHWKVWTGEPCDNNIKFEKGTFNDRITYINGFAQTLEDAGIEFDNNNIPINPMGRTGMYGPGLLGKNGPNHTADPIFTRWAPFTLLPLQAAIYDLKNIFTFDYVEKIVIHILIKLWNIFKEIILLFPHLQMISVQRRDTKDWAIPGGMVEAGQTVSETLRNEINQEACNNMDPDKASAEIDEILNQDNGDVIYCGYVDDPRNTDSRWLETTAVHYHCDGKLANAIKLEAGDDAQRVMWLDMTSLDSKYRNLYANHKMMTDKAMMKFYGRYIMNTTIIITSILLFRFFIN